MYSDLATRPLLDTEEGVAQDWEWYMLSLPPWVRCVH